MGSNYTLIVDNDSCVETMYSCCCVCSLRQLKIAEFVFQKNLENHIE
jgi:hypothetical protein